MASESGLSRACWVFRNRPVSTPVGLLIGLAGGLATMAVMYGFFTLVNAALAAAVL